MFEEFDHFFKDDDPVQEEYFDLIVNDEIILEAYSKKEKNRIKKFLKENNFKEDNSSLTDEEIRKGYRRGTIETSITDKNGKKKRVEFEITPHPEGSKFQVGKKKDGETITRIKMEKRELAKKPHISNFIFKHEEGHYAVYLDKQTGKYVIDLYKIKRLIEKHPEVFSALNPHDADPEEVFADRYALKNISNKYKNRAITTKSDGNGTSIRAAAPAMSDFVRHFEKEADKFAKRGPSASYWYHKDQVRDIEHKTEVVRYKIERLKTKIEFHQGMIKQFESWADEAEKKLTAVEMDRLQDISKGFINDKFLNTLKKDIDDYDKYIFMIRGKIASLEETKKYYQEIVHSTQKIERSAENKKRYLGAMLHLEKEYLTDEEIAKLKKTLARIENSSTVKKAVDDGNEAFDKMCSLSRQMDELYKDLDKNYKERSLLEEAKSSQKLTASINRQKEMLNKCIDKYKTGIRSYKKAVSKDVAKLAKLRDSLVYLRDAYDKHSRLAKYSPDPDKMSRDDKNKYMNKHIRDRYGDIDSTVLRSIIAANSDEEVENIIDKFMQESYVDDDDTSGTSDFDTCIDNDPDDCYCESSVVFDKGQKIKVDVSELPFDTVYHGSIKNISMFDDKRTVFVTPSIAMASIFAGRPDIYKLREIKQRYHVESPDINLQYLEWSDPKTLTMKQPLKTVHVIMQGAPEITDHYKYRQAGYIYAFNIKDPAIRDHVYKSTAMGPNEYVIKGIKPVPIEKIPIEIDVDVTGAELPERFKQEETLPTSGDFAQYAQYADLDSARGPIQSIHMRPATQADTENMYNWEIESIHPDLQTKPDVQELIRKDVQESIKDTQMIMDGDKTIGMFTACMIDGGEWRYIGEIYLIPEYRGKGIGTSILKNEIDKFDKIRLQVATTNTGAIKLYESLGFKIVKEVDGQMYLMEYDATKGLVQEAKLPAKKRNKLPDSDFALVYVDQYGDKVRKYPINDEAHVRAAARMFPKGVPLKYKKEVANKILHRAHKYDIDTSGWKSINAAVGK